MEIEVRKGTADDASAVADFWNAKAQDPSSWWYGSPQKTADDIANLLSQGFSLVVALDHGVLIGFGLWLGPRLLGFTALNRDAFYRMLRVWAEENPGQRGLSVIPARDTTEMAWFDALRTGEITPMGYKPIGRGDDPTKRKPWTCRLEGSLDALRAAVDTKLAEAVR
ncbi:MAG: hypothetical protein AB7L90_22900 [Hyphomicrobiaceae bacterium]